MSLPSSSPRGGDDGLEETPVVPGAQEAAAGFTPDAARLRDNLRAEQAETEEATRFQRELDASMAEARRFSAEGSYASSSRGPRSHAHPAQPEDLASPMVINPSSIRNESTSTSTRLRVSPGQLRSFTLAIERPRQPRFDVEELEESTISVDLAPIPYRLDLPASPTIANPLRAALNATSPIRTVRQPRPGGVGNLSIPADQILAMAAAAARRANGPPFSRFGVSYRVLQDHQALHDRPSAQSRYSQGTGASANMNVHVQRYTRDEAERIREELMEDEPPSGTLEMLNPLRRNRNHGLPRLWADGPESRWRDILGQMLTITSRTMALTIQRPCQSRVQLASRHLSEGLLLGEEFFIMAAGDPTICTCAGGGGMAWRERWRKLHTILYNLLILSFPICGGGPQDYPAFQVPWLRGSTKWCAVAQHPEPVAFSAGSSSAPSSSSLAGPSATSAKQAPVTVVNEEAQAIWRRIARVISNYRHNGCAQHPDPYFRGAPLDTYTRRVKYEQAPVVEEELHNNSEAEDGGVRQYRTRLPTHTVPSTLPRTVGGRGGTLHLQRTGDDPRAVFYHLGPTNSIARARVASFDWHHRGLDLRAARAAAHVLRHAPPVDLLDLVGSYGRFFVDVQTCLELGLDLERIDAIVWFEIDCAVQGRLVGDDVGREMWRVWCGNGRERMEWGGEAFWDD